MIPTVSHEYVVCETCDTPLVYVFDLDGTLYPVSNGYEAACKERVFNYMVDTLRCAPTILDAKQLWLKGFEKYHQSLKTLRALGASFNEDEYWRFIRGDCSAVLTPSKETREFIRRLPGKKYVFTNCHEKQALEALRVLDLADCFDGILGAHKMGDCCKPEVEAFQLMLAEFDIKDPSHCIFFEDSIVNLQTASSKFNMTTILVTSPNLPFDELQQILAEDYVDGVVVGQNNLLKCLNPLRPDSDKLLKPRAVAALSRTRSVTAGDIRRE